MANIKFGDLPANPAIEDTDIFAVSKNGAGSRKSTKVQVKESMSTNESQIYSVGKEGNASNSGLNVNYKMDEPSTAIAAIIALRGGGWTPDPAEAVTISCRDSGTYGLISIKDTATQYINVDMESARCVDNTAVSAVGLTDNTSVCCKEIISSIDSGASAAISKYSGSGTATVRTQLAQSNAGAFANRGIEVLNGTLISFVDHIVVNSTGNGIYVADGGVLNHKGISCPDNIVIGDNCTVTIELDTLGTTPDTGDITIGENSYLYLKVYGNWAGAVTAIGVNSHWSSVIGNRTTTVGDTSNTGVTAGRLVTGNGAHPDANQEIYLDTGKAIVRETFFANLKAQFLPTYTYTASASFSNNYIQVLILDSSSDQTLTFNENSGDIGESWVEGSVAYITNVNTGEWIIAAGTATVSSSSHLGPIQPNETIIAVRDSKTTYRLLRSEITKRTDAGAADYNPSTLTSDYIVTTDNSAAARNVIISTEDVQSGSTTVPRVFIITDESGNAGTNNITLSLESGNINDAANYVMNNDNESVILYLDGTNGWIAANYDTAAGGTSYWSRTGTTLEPATAGDDVDLGTGEIIAAGIGAGTSSLIYTLQANAESSGLAVPLLIENQDGGAVAATGIRFKVVNDTTDVRSKAAIFFERTSAGGVGSLHLAVEGTNDDSNVDLTDVKFTIDSAGDISMTGDLDITGDISAADAHFTGKLTVDGAIDPTMLVLDPQGSAPGTANGTIYYNSSSNDFQFRENGAWVTLGGTGYWSRTGTVLEPSNSGDSLRIGSGGFLTSSNDLIFQNDTSSAPAFYKFFTADGDGSEEIALALYAVGTPGSTTNSEYFAVGYDEATNEYILESVATGTGTLRPFQFRTGSNSNQLLLETDGNVSMSGDLDVTGDIDGAEITGTGITINDSTPKLLFADTNDDYFSIMTEGDDDLHFSSEETGASAYYKFFSYDGDGTDTVSMQIFGVGTTASQSNNESLKMEYNTGYTLFQIYSSSSGTGTLRALRLGAGSAVTSNQLSLSADGRVGMTVAAPLAQLHIDQKEDDEAIPVLALDQADVSEGFINFIGSDRGVISESTSSTESVRVEINGTVRRLALYADA